MYVKKLLSQMNWDFFEMAGLSYKTATALANNCKSNQKFFNMKAELWKSKKSNPWDPESETCIRIENGRYTLSGISEGLMVKDETVQNGLIAY